MARKLSGRAIQAGTITANAFVANISVGGVAQVYDVTATGTGYFDLPNGTTAERPATPPLGALRYNTTTGFAEVYTSAGWGTFGAQPPSISSVSPATYNGEQGTVFTINGANFTADAVVRFVDNANNEYIAASVTFVNSATLLASTPQDFTVAQEPLDVKVVQSSGQVTRIDCIDCGGSPTWTTPAGSLGIIYDIMRTTANIGVTASDPDANASITYSVVSGAIPAGMTLNVSTGALTGNANAVVSDTTYNFTVRALDNAGNSSDRAFSCIVKAPVTQAFTYTGVDQTFSVPSGLTIANAYLWGGAGGGASAEGYSDSGGAGGYATGTISLSGISTLLVQVGSGGGRGTSSRPARAYPNGGLNSIRNSYTSGAGGGRSAIFNGNTVSASSAILVAGGGGGASGHGGGGPAASYNMGGGSGGGTNGAGGMGYTQANVEKTNYGTQSAAGTSSSGAGREAAQFQGADAGNGTLWDSGGWNAAGGGGDGWYGGGVINNEHCGGSGGSGYANVSLVSNSTLSVTAQTSGKKSTVNPPQNTSTYYSAGIGVGSANGDGGNGRVVIVY